MKIPFKNLVQKTHSPSTVLAIFSAFPILEMMSKKFAEYFDDLPLEGQQFSVVAINKAVEIYEEQVDLGIGEDEAIKYFVMSLINTGTKVFDYTYAIDSETGSYEWVPFIDSFTNFSKTYKGTVIVTPKISTIAMDTRFAFVATWVVPHSLITSSVWNEIVSTIKVPG